MAENDVHSVGMSEVTERTSDSNLMTNNQRTAMSAALVVDAKDGRLVLSQSPDSIDVKLYFFYRHPIFQTFLYLTMILHHLIVLLEHNSKNEIWIICLELICLTIYLIRLIHLLVLSDWSLFRTDKKNIIVVTTIFATILEIFISFLFNDYIRWTPVLRPLFVINLSDNKQVTDLTSNAI